MHDFNASDRTPGGPQGLEAEHGIDDPFHGSLILLDAGTKLLLDLRGVFADPPVEGGMIDQRPRSFIISSS
jgi:hypothetical protein